MAAYGPPADNASQTLNVALGNLGGRQPSWMYSTTANPNPHPMPAPTRLTAQQLPSAVRYRGRPPQKRAPEAPIDAARPSIEPPAVTQPQPQPQPHSNSTSPQLANVLTRHEHPHHGPSAVTVFPSPTPSEETMPLPSLRGGDGTRANLDYYELHAERANDVQNTLPEAVSPNSARRHAPGSKRPSEEAGTQRDKRRHFGGNGQEQPPPRPPPQHPQNHSPYLEQTQSRSPSIPQRPNGPAQSPHLAQLQGPLHHRRVLSQETAPHPPASVPADTDSSPAMPNGPLGLPQHAQAQVVPSHRGHIPPQAIAPRPPLSVPAETEPSQTISNGPVQSQRLAQPPAVISQRGHVASQPTWYTRNECLSVLSAFRQAHTTASSRPRDGNRLRVLQDATELEDWSYLVMHQIYCLLDHNPSVLPAKIRSQPGLDQVMLMMEDVLDRNSKLSPAALAFFSSYPYTWERISVEWPMMRDQQIRAFAYFVSLSKSYAPFKFFCERRRYPPLAWELAHYLGIESTVLQRILFTAVLRTLWQDLALNDEPPKLEYEARAISLFRRNQVDYRHRLSSKRKISPSQISQDNESDTMRWGPQLRQVVDELEAILRRPTYLDVTPHATNPLQPQQQTFHMQQNPQLHAQHSSHLLEPQDRETVVNETEMSRRAHRPAPSHTAHPTAEQPRGPPHTQAVPRALYLPSQHQGQQPNASKPFLPPPGWLQSQQRQPNPTRFSLHQAHLRSPVMRARSLDSPLYHFVQGYIKAPVRLSNANRAVEKWTFKLDTNMMHTVAVTVPDTASDVGKRLVDTSSKTVRLRCIKWPNAADPPSDYVWASTDTYWLPHSYFIFNEVSLEQRKKIHHGKDLPIDITGLLVEGENVLNMSVMAPSTDLSFLDYLVAIEFLGFMSHDKIKQDCVEKYRIPAQQVLSEIQKKLRGSSNNDDDDDIAIVESSLTINLRDPFSAAKMCDIPVRGRACLHSDCFDLEIFLSSRQRKGDVSVSDAWRCPICNADARPDRLVVDGFLEEVKKQLDAKGLSKTRAIIVHQDGTWKPKAEVRDPNGVSDRGVSDSPTPDSRRHSIPAEIIDISD